MRIRIGFPENRDFEGRLEVFDAGDALVFGPVPAAGRAHDEPAATHANPSRSPLLPYGDTPLGTFAVRGVFDSVGSGPFAVVLLEPLSGQAALADAHGRFRLFIQGGGDEKAQLRATTGAIRLRDQDQGFLVDLLRRASGRVVCEVVPDGMPGARVSLTTPPPGHDPPPLPGRSFMTRPPSAPGLSRAIRPLEGAPASYRASMFVVVPERSGSGGTDYGGAGGVGGGGSSGDTGGAGGTGATGGPGDAGPFPDGGVDAAPAPGRDLNPPPDDTVTAISQSGGSDLLSTAAPTGLSNPYAATENGWIVGPQPTDPSTGLPATGDPLQPYVGHDASSFSGAPPDSEKPNSFTGEPSADPATNSTVAFEPDARPNPNRDPADAAEAQQRLQDFIDQGNALDASRAGSRAPLASDEGTPPPGTTQSTPQPDATPGTTSSGPQRDSINDPDAAIQEMVARFAKYDADLAASQSQSQSNDGPLPWGPAAVAGGVSSQGGGFAGEPPVSGRPTGPAPPRSESAGAWNRGNPSPAALEAIQEQIRLGFLDPALAHSNVATATGQTPGSISRLIRGQTGEISAYDARLARGETGILAPKGASLRGLDYATASQLPNGDYQINVGDTASRYTENPFKTSPGTPPDAWLAELSRAFGPNGGFSLPDPAAEQGIRNAFNEGRVSPVQIDTVDFSSRGQGKLTLNGAPLEPTSPSSRGALPKNPSGIGDSAIGGARFGAGFATVLNLYQILSDPNAHPDAARELATTGFLGAASGGAGAAIETAFEKSILPAAGTAAETDLFTTLAGRSLGGAAGGGPAAAVFTVGEMLLSDKQYSAEDYEAKGTRAFAAGAVSGAGGALAAGLVGAIAGSEVPILGNIVGFAVGFGGYLLFDALFGDDIENSVRSQHQLGDFETTRDPSGYFSG